MSDRRSSRPRKQVDYSKFGVMSTDDDDVDDFVDDLTPPPPQKRAKKETKSKKDTQQKAMAAGKEGKRRSLDEKLYARDLQLAIEKSTATKESKSPNTDANTSHSKSLTTSRDCTGPEKVTVENGENGCTEKQRQAAANARLKLAEGCPQGQDDQTNNQQDNNGDEDYNVEKEVISAMSSDDDDDDDESDDVSDFEDSLKRPAKKKTSDHCTRKVKVTSPAEGKSAKKASRPQTKVKPNIPLTSEAALPTGNSSRVVRAQPAARKQVPHLAATSYRSPLGGTSLRSPGGSTLRLGLSRRANVKPLHAIAKVT